MLLANRLLFAGLLAAGSASANALLITQDRQFAIADATPWINAFGQTQIAQGVDLAFERFDPALGTLTAAHWRIRSTLAVQAQAEVTGNGQFVTAGSLDYWISAYTSDAFGQPSLRGTATALGGGHADGASCTVPGDTFICPITLSAALTLDQSVAVGDLSAMIGAGSFTQPLVAAMGLTAAPDALTGMMSKGGFAWSDIDARGGLGHLTLVYDYEPLRSEVPEPAPLTVLALTLPAVLAASRTARRSPPPSRPR